jgi:hypothetical protein
MLWVSDYPYNAQHGPNSLSLLRELTAPLSDDQKRWILRDNVVDLYKLDVARRRASSASDGVAVASELPRWSIDRVPTGSAAHTYA